MRLSLRSLLAPSLALSLSFSAPLAVAQDDANVRNWQMFAHFVNVARPDQAKPFGEKLLTLDNAAFLAAIEGDRLHKFDDIAEWGLNEELKPTWEKIEDKYQQALTERSRDTAQIRADIQALAGGEGGVRQEFLAIQRLKQTGQFAAPYYLEVLQDSTQRRLHPRVINAMIEVGSELSYPLSIALEHVDPATQIYIARVVGEIGYPEALPYLKHVADSDVDANVKRACLASFNQIVETSGLDAAGSAAELFVKIGEAKYSVGTRNDELLGMDLANETGIIWRFNKDAGLVPIAVPERIYADALAMQNAVSALSLENEMASAVTLHLASNNRRENRLDGEQDPGYQLPNPATFYLLVAGAPQQKLVLTRGLNDADPALSLDALEAMAKTVGNKVLLGSDETRAPVLDALYFSSRRVRYTAAITLASASPDQAFSGSVSVVPVLGQAVRQSDTLNAIVVAPGGADVLNAAMENIDFKSVGDIDLNRAANKAAQSMPGVDLVVYNGDFNGFEAMYASAKADGSLSIAPILALVEDGVAAAIKVNYPGVQTAAPIADASSDAEADRLDRLSKLTISNFGGEPISASESLAYAETALGLLKTIAAHDTIYNASDVEPILIEALDDDRASVAIGSGQVLELMNSATAQQGLADAALARVGEVQIALFNALAESAKAHGNQLSRKSIDDLIELVNASNGNTALAAARALGALTERPTSDTSGFILGK